MDSANAISLHAPPVAYPELPPTGGKVGPEPEDFVVDEVPLSPSFRPNPRPLREQGLPGPGERCWYYDAREGAYAELIEKSDALVGSGDTP